MPLHDPKVHGPKYVEQPGMNDPQRDADSKTWEVPVQMLTAGEFMGLNDMPDGPYVGDPYSGVTGLGEEREMITYPGRRGAMGRQRK